MPILLQIPVFFALYKVLFINIQMRHAPFYGWIEDLSALDPTSILNLFGLLPYSTASFPDFMNLGVWPILMGITMFVQMSLNPPPPDPSPPTPNPHPARRISNPPPDPLRKSDSKTRLVVKPIRVRVRVRVGFGFGLRLSETRFG